MFFGAFGAEEEDMSVLGRLGKGDVGRDGASCDDGGVGIVHSCMGEAKFGGRAHAFILIHACMQISAQTVGYT